MTVREQDRLVTIGVLALLAALFVLVPTLLEFSELQTDLLAGVLLFAAIAFYAYQDHRRAVEHARLLKSLAVFIGIPGFAMTLALALFPNFQFAYLLPLNALLVGWLYVHIDKHTPKSEGQK